MQAITNKRIIDVVINNDTDREDIDKYELDDAVAYVKLSLHDSGPGIDIKDVDKLFNAGHTSKKDGNGLGLYIIKEILDNNQGMIFLDPDQKIGCKFDLFLPKN